MKKTPLLFLGTVKVEYDLFQYHILRTSEDELVLRLEHNVRNPFLLKQFDLVNLHLPLFWNGNYYPIGRVDDIDASIKESAIDYALTLIQDPTCNCLLRLEQTGNLPKVHFLEDPKKIIEDCIKNLLLLKQGISVYLTHLSTYFSRLIGCNMKLYPEFCTLFFEPSRNKLQEKIIELTFLSEEIRKRPTFEERYVLIDFTFLLKYIESEINLDILNLSFNSNSHIPYIVAIKELEESMHWQYNTLLALKGEV